jgi:4-carboxymuconolactone decarboxylase
MDKQRYDKGVEQRSAVLGADRVQSALMEASDFNKPFQEAMTEWCWGFGWGDETIDKKTRSMLNLVMIAALNRMEEWELHLRGSARTGVSREEVQSLIHIIGIYCGVPAAVSCFRIANQVFKELDAA